MTTVLHPTSLAEANEALLAHENARALGGGTAIQIFRQQRLLFPEVLVDLSAIPELQGIRRADGLLAIGAMATHREVEQSPLVRALAPLLSETYRQVANVRIRNTATVGGNLAHGDYRLDPPASLLVLGASVRLWSANGAREIPIGQFFLGLHETTLAPGDLLVEIRLPVAHPARSHRFEKFASLAANDWPCVSVAALLEWDGAGALAAARLGITAVSPTPLLVALDDVAGFDQPRLADRAVEAALAVVDPLPDLRGSAEYKRLACAAVVRDAITAAWRGQREAEVR
jgi:carbon-monoxide dehydrogenase medium subunit